MACPGKAWLGEARHGRVAGVSAFATRSPDGRTQPQIILDHIRAASLRPGDLITYETLHEILDRGDSEDERHAVRGAARAASRRLLTADGHCLVSVPDVGYRITEAAEHLRLGKDREKRGSRQFQQAITIYDGTPLDELTPAQRELHQNTSMLAKAAFAAISDHERRIRRVERLIGGLGAPKVIEGNVG
jgi:hypothetical protein